MSGTMSALVEDGGYVSDQEVETTWVAVAAGGADVGVVVVVELMLVVVRDIAMSDVDGEDMHHYGREGVGR